MIWENRVECRDITQKSQNFLLISEGPIGLDSTIIYYYQIKWFDTKLNILNKKIEYS